MFFTGVLRQHSELQVNGNAPRQDPVRNFICYYTNWAQDHIGPGAFFPENVDPFLCTHIHYANAILKNFELAPFQWNDEDMDWSPGM